MVVAAGGGSRFGGPKQFSMIRGSPMVDWSVAAAKGTADGVVLVLAPADPHLAKGDNRGADVVVAGGDTRSASVRAGLGAVPSDSEVIVVHDGARPLASPALFKAVIEAVLAGADAAVPALPVADTLKRVEADVVAGRVPRDHVWAIQTPQAFRADVIRAAHASWGEDTDDAGLVEGIGASVRVVPGDARNLKVTTPADLELVQALAEAIF